MVALARNASPSKANQRTTDLGTASIVLSIIGISISWIPYVGWSGVLLGVLGLSASIPSITHWHQKPGYTGWGISGLFLGFWSFSLGLAYQIKYAEGALDYLVVPVVVSQLIPATIILGVIVALGLFWARVHHRNAGVLIAAVAMLAISLLSGWTLITADRAYEQSHLTASTRQSP